VRLNLANGLPPDCPFGGVVCGFNQAIETIRDGYALWRTEGASDWNYKDLSCKRMIGRRP